MTSEAIAVPIVFFFSHLNQPSTMKKIIQTTQAPAPVGPYNQAIAA
jgi:hypothetical protein